MALGPSIQDGRTKSSKIDPSSLVRTGSAPLSVWTHYKFRKILCVLNQKVRTSAPEVRKKSPWPQWTNPWLRTSFMDKPFGKRTYLH